ncbi:MAG: hypothetical protein ACK5LL_02500 [Suipraeoptans sp.]
MSESVKDTIKDPKELISSYSSEQAEQVMLILQANNIRAYKQPIGKGKMMDMYIKSYSIGEEIFVSDNDLEKANQLLHTAGILGENNRDQDKVNYSKTAIWLARFSIAAIFLGVIIALMLIIR